ncbi:hypothetical protein VTO58DRAFT_107049 [Aureobasidium pullulans]
MAASRFSTEDTENDHDLVIPWSYVDPTLNDEVATEQHKARRGQQLQKRSIRHYRHTTTKWGAALESFSPLWFAVCISSGGIALVLNGPFPYRGHWLVVLAKRYFW